MTSSTLNELKHIFYKEVAGNQSKTLQEKYWMVVELQTKLKEIFRYYYEYELFRLVLQDYYNGLQKLLNSNTSSRFKQFKKSSSSSSSSSNKKSIIYNTPSYSYQKPKSSRRDHKFGEPLTDPLLLQKSNDALLHTLPQEHVYPSKNLNNAQRIIKCDYDFFFLMVYYMIYKKYHLSEINN